jgi:putative phosphotransacetylase
MDRPDEAVIRHVVQEVLQRIFPAVPRVDESGIPVLINVSNRHMHITKEDLEALFGSGAELEKLRDLMQPGEFASKSLVTLAGQNGVIRDVRILGPVRSYTQVEISLTDSFQLGIKSPLIRDSGAHEGTPGITAVGPAGAVTLRKGVILAQRHIHMHTDDGKRFGFRDGDWARVRIEGPRALVLERVLVRVKSTYAFEMHVDIDEANACALKSGDYGRILK